MSGSAVLRRLDDERRTRGLRYLRRPLPALLVAGADVELEELGVDLDGGDLSSWVGVPARLEMDDGRWFEGHVTDRGGFRARHPPLWPRARG